MTPRTLLFAANAALLLGAAALGWSLRQDRADLRGELDALRAQASEVAHLQAEHQRLAALQLPARELEQLRADHLALDPLKAEVLHLESRAAARLQDAVAASSRSPDTSPTPTDAGPVLSVKTAKNVGRATSTDTLETLLWAARTRDLDGLAATFYLSQEGRALVKALLADLPATAGSSRLSWERQLAALVADDLPPGSVHVLKNLPGTQPSPDVENLSVRLATPDGAPTERIFQARRADDGWKFHLPDAMVEKYAAQLKARAALGPTGPK